MSHACVMGGSLECRCSVLVCTARGLGQWQQSLGVALVMAIAPPGLHPCATPLLEPALDTLWEASALPCCC